MRLGKVGCTVVSLLVVASGLTACTSSAGNANSMPDLANPASSAASAFLAQEFPVNSADWSAGMKLTAFESTITSKQFNPCLQSKGFPPPPAPQGLGGGNNLTFPNLSLIAKEGFFGPTTTKTSRPPTTNTTQAYESAYTAAEMACSKTVHNPLQKLATTFTAPGGLGRQWRTEIRRINETRTVTKALGTWKHCMQRAGVQVSTPTRFFGSVTGVMHSLPPTQAIPAEKHLAATYARCFGPVEALRVRMRIQQRNKLFAEHAEAIDTAMRRVTTIVAKLSSAYHTVFEVKRA